MECFVLLAVVALALAAPLVLGWRRRGWQGLAVLHRIAGAIRASSGTSSGLPSSATRLLAGLLQRLAAFASSRVGRQSELTVR